VVEFFSFAFLRFPCVLRFYVGIWRKKIKSSHARQRRTPGVEPNRVGRESRGSDKWGVGKIPAGRASGRAIRTTTPAPTPQVAGGRGRAAGTRREHVAGRRLLRLPRVLVFIPNYQVVSVTLR
jgi:hypothetical protein